MKQFIKSVVLFSLFAGLFYVLVILVCGRLLPNFFHGNILTENKISAQDDSKRRFLSVETSNPVDVLFLGSSHAYRGYDPRLFNAAGFSSYNLGSSSQPLTLTEVIYRDFNDKYKPKVIIIDVYPVLLSNTGGEGEINVLPLFYNNYLFVKNTFKTFDVRVLNSLIYFQAFGDKKSIKSTRLNNEKFVIGGYISSFKNVQTSKNYVTSTLKIDLKNVTALKNIAKHAEKRGIKVFLFQAPLPEERYKSYNNNKEIDSLMHSIGKYYNYNDVGFLPSQYFMDDSHINQKGVDIYNKWVIDKIKENE